MTDAFLQCCGFTVAHVLTRQLRLPFAMAWRYQHTHAAADGAPLYAEHPLGIARCRLSTVVAPLHPLDVLADVALDDRAGFEAAVAAFFTARGGLGLPIVPPALPAYLPYRRKR